MSTVGWRTALIAGNAALARAVQEADTIGSLVLVADSSGNVPDPREALAGRSRLRVIAVCASRAFAALADIVSCRAADAVADADQPFSDLVAALDRLLRLTPASTDQAALAARLQAREGEARRFAGLSRREQEVLSWLLAGSSAAEIADTEMVSMATVRSHLRAVLIKLGVSSQVAAVALTHRSCREPALVERMRAVHQY